MSLLVIDNYDSFTYNLVQQLQGIQKGDDSAPGNEIRVYRNDALTLDEVIALKPSGILLSPGPGHPKNPRDFGVGHDILTHLAPTGLPIFGVCLGHQGIVHHYGGHILKAPEVCHGKTSPVTVLPLSNGKPSTLFQKMPPVFEAMRYHSLVADESTLPHCLEVSARVQDESGLIMAVQHRALPIFGVQFHPESVGTPLGVQILRNFLEICSNQKQPQTA